MPQLFTNNARALLASGITDTATSLTVEASKADLFPTANTDTNPVPAATNWFKITLQNDAGEVEIIYVRTRTAGSAIMSNLLRGQEGTTARAFSAGTVVGLRITAADVEDSIAAAANSVQLTGNQTIAGVKTFSSQIVASGGVQGNVTGNAGTVTNGVYTTGDQTIGGTKTFTGNVLVTSNTGGLGYGTGAGGTVTQATSKGTAVTLNRPTGQITMNNAALAAGASVAFTCFNSLCSLNDNVVVSYVDDFGANYRTELVSVWIGYFQIRLTNVSAGSLSQAVRINFAIIKGAAS